MEPGVGARPRRRLAWWFRGGVWKIERSSDMRHIVDHVPEDDTEILDDDIWVCVNQDGSFNIERDIRYWEDYGTMSGSDTHLAELETPESDIYFPLHSEPDLYLTFASLGRQTWDSLGGLYLSEHTIEHEDREDFLPESLKKRIVEFHVSYGPPYMLWEFTNRARTYTSTVHSMLRQAQLIDLMIGYQRVLAGEAGIGTLRDRIVAVRDSEQREVDRANLVGEHRWQEGQQMMETVEKRGGRVPDETAAKYSQGYQPKRNKFDGLDLRGDPGVIASIEKVVLEEATKFHAIGGLVIEADLLPPTAAPRLSGWGFTFRFTHLLNVIWYQAFQAIMRDVLLRRCPSNNCDRPGGLFAATRPNRVYCSDRCRNYSNVQAHRRRTRGRQNGDLLP